MDSIALAHALWSMRARFKLDLAIAYVHHGVTKNKKQNEFRNKAEKLVKKTAQAMDVPFFSIRPHGSGTSESEMREARYKGLQELSHREGFDVIAVGHHRDDLLESRIIRLIRGVGEQGLMAMSELSSGIYRPFLNLDRAKLEEYVVHLKLEYVEDPSNRDNVYLRNWIRNVWLPELENYRPGSKGSLSVSLENLSVKAPLDPAGLVTEEGISRSNLLGLPKSEQRRVVAHYLRKKNVKNYTSSQIDEILKRLDTSQKALTFRVVGLDWTVDTRHIRCLTS